MRVIFSDAHETIKPKPYLTSRTKQSITKIVHANTQTSNLKYANINNFLHGRKHPLQKTS